VKIVHYTMEICEIAILPCARTNTFSATLSSETFLGRARRLFKLSKHACIASAFDVGEPFGFAQMLPVISIRTADPNPYPRLQRHYGAGALRAMSDRARNMRSDTIGHNEQYSSGGVGSYPTLVR
jgi:hypothetical protein